MREGGQFSELIFIQCSYTSYSAQFCALSCLQLHVSKDAPHFLYCQSRLRACFFFFLIIIVMVLSLCLVQQLGLLFCRYPSSSHPTNSPVACIQSVKDTIMLHRQTRCLCQGLGSALVSSSPFSNAYTEPYSLV